MVTQTIDPNLGITHPNLQPTHIAHVSLIWLPCAGQCFCPYCLCLWEYLPSHLSLSRFNCPFKAQTKCKHLHEAFLMLPGQNSSPHFWISRALCNSLGLALESWHSFSQQIFVGHWEYSSEQNSQSSSPHWGSVLLHMSVLLISL